MTQNLAYALTQVVHNLGAAAVVGGAFCALARPCREPVFRRRLAWLVLVAWAAQAASGAAFGAVSLYFYGRPPDIHAIALAALLVKMGCAAAGFSLAALCLFPPTRIRPFFQDRVWFVLAGLGLTAITAAAFLRWFA